MSSLSQLKLFLKKPKNVDEDFSGVWDATRIIDTLSEMIRLKGIRICDGFSIESYDYDKSNPWSVRYWQLMSVLNAYGKSLNIDSLKPDWLFLNLVSVTHSEEKLTEIRNILKEITTPENSNTMNELIHSVMEDGDLHTLANIFATIFYLYLSYKTISEPFAGVIETSRSIFCTLKFVEQSSYKATNELQEKLKELLVRLMGDAFNTPITEKELIAKYNYPIISNKELKLLEMEYNC